MLHPAARSRQQKNTTAAVRRQEEKPPQTNVSLKKRMCGTAQGTRRPSALRLRGGRLCSLFKKSGTLPEQHKEHGAPKDSREDHD